MANHELIQKYVDDFLEKVFYFCVKRCGNPARAEDLASDINLNILSALSGEFVPQNFHAWVWAVARNQYSKWAAQIHKLRENVLPDDVGEYKVASEESFEDDFVHAEQIKILRRELDFVASEYREIIIAYYIDGKKTEEIAESLHIPKGTVVSKLHHIRKKLKEGFDFPVLAYGFFPF
jgi:RNA polymerase sigma-70 factor (ECF subfamily)